MAHLVRGVSTEALEDNFVKACVKGAINKRRSYSQRARGSNRRLKNENNKRMVKNPE
jgi:hypothetical protein